jgi:hypothetical protein
MIKKPARILCWIAVVLMVATSGCIDPTKENTIPSPGGNFFTSNQTPLATTTPSPVPVVDPVPGIDPVPDGDPYPNALPLNSNYHIENPLNDLRYPPTDYPSPSPTKNDVSIEILRASLWDSYTVETPASYQTTGPLPGKKFVVIALNINNYAGNQGIITPIPSNFALLYDGSMYLPADIEDPVQSAGKSYTSEKIARLEKTGGALVYEVPSSLTLDRSYIQLIFSNETGKNPVWRLNSSSSVPRT